jgi:hypothetical protein
MAKDIKIIISIDTKAYKKSLSDFYTYALLNCVTLDTDYTDALIRLHNSHANKVFYQEYREVIIEMTSIRSQVFN